MAPQPGIRRAPAARAVPGATVPGVPACGRGDVVLSLVSPQNYYPQQRWPLFGVVAVSTAATPCSFNMGGRFATVVVSSGRARAWGSGDCVRGTGSQPVVLSRGVPAIRWVYWDRSTSVPGCGQQASPAPLGAYAAIAFDGELSSQVIIFSLGRPGPYLP